MLRKSALAACAAFCLIAGYPALGRTSLKNWPRTETPSSRLKESGLPQFGRLNDHIWRSGQPTRKGYKRLAEMGLKTVINLRAEYPQDKRLCPKGVTYVYIPMRDKYPPTDRQVHELLRMVSDSNNWPVLIHCESGESRTGLMSAAIRYSLDGWDDHKIMQELRNFQVKYLGIAKIPLTHKERHWMHQWELKNQPGAFTL